MKWSTDNSTPRNSKALRRAVDAATGRSLSESHDLLRQQPARLLVFVAGKAPLDVKRAIWRHEKDELIHDDRMGRAHVTEQDLQAGDESLLAPARRRHLYAWLYCAREKPWLEGLVYSHILERRNNSAIVKGGGLVERWKRKQRAELGTKEAEKDFQTEVHAVADEDPLGYLRADLYALR